MRAALGWLLAVAVVLAVNAGVVYLVGVHGNFPLGDDWAYAWPVRSLCEQGEIDLLPWTGASAVVQIGYGAALCEKLGFSFETLRASTLVLGVLADLGLLMLLRLFAVPTSVALVATLAFALTPLRVNLAFTFMTDLPFTALAVWSAYFYARGLGSRRTLELALGASLCVAAVLVRQHGIFVAAAAALAALPFRHPDLGVQIVPPEIDPKAARTLRRRLGLKPAPLPAADLPAEPSEPAREPYRARLVRAAICLGPPAAALVLFYAWLFWIHGAPEAVARKANEATNLDLLGLGNLAFRGAETLGASLLPLTLVAAGLVLRTVPIRSFFAMLVLGVASGLLWAREGALMPYLPNVVYDFGVGALTLRDTLFLGFPPQLEAGVAFRWALTIVATVSAGVLVAALSSVSKAVRAAESDFVALVLLFLLGGSLLHTRYYFDRYLLPALPFAALLGAIGLESIRVRRRAVLEKAVRDVAETRARPSAAAAVMLLAVGCFSVGGTRDWMEMNRARFALLDRLVAEGVTPDRIDGGFEFNAWHLAKTSGRAPTDAEVVVGRESSAKSWWWVIDDEYVISTRELDGYDIHALHIYRRALPPGEATVYALRRRNPPQP
jgi:hypothetical protein